MIDIDMILNELLSENIYIIYGTYTLPYMNKLADYLLSVDKFNEDQKDKCNKLLRVCNIIYNNTDLDILPLEDGIYDLLLEKYKEYDKKFQVGADVVYLNAKDLDIDNDVFAPLPKSERVKEEPEEIFFKIPDDDFNFLNQMYYKEELLDRGNLSYIDDRDLTAIQDAEITGKRYRTISHNNPELVGTLDKCKFVYNKQAVDKGVFDDPKVKILERDFFEQHFKMGLIDNTSIIHMVAEIKYDGTSIVGIIENRQIVSAYSRGDTGMGKTTDYTPIFRGYYFPRLPENHEPIEVKFEAIMTYHQLSIYNQVRGASYKNCRSAINGLLGANDAPMYRNFITLVPLKVSMDGIEMDRITEISFINNYLFTGEFLRHAYISGDFTTVLYKINMFVKEAERARDYMPFMYDGVVVSYIDPIMIEALGRENFINKYSMAIKFNALNKYTRLLSVDYTIGQDGTITPMAHYSPIEFLGTIHTKATISSLGRFMKLGMHIGDTIEVEYINDVIPYVVRVVETSGREPIEFITKCPSCGSQLIISDSGESVKCPNINCPERNIKRMDNMMSKLGVKDFAEEMMRAINIFSLSDLLHITREEIIHIGDVNSLKFIEAMKQLKTNPVNDYVIIGSLGFTGLSKETWKKILNVISTSEILDLYNKNTDKLRDVLLSIKGIGGKSVDTILTEINFFYKDLVEISLMKNVIVTKGGVQKKIRFSGVRDIELVTYLNSNGYDAGEGSVTKDTSLLIIPNSEYTSTKTDKANLYGIPIMTIQDFKESISYPAE